MHGCVWRAGSAAIAIALCMLSADAVAAGRVVAAGRLVALAQNVSGAGGGDSVPSQSSVAATPTGLPANTPEQIRKAQTELKRLDCLKGRVDGKLGDRTRDAVRKFWISAKQPAVEVDITDQLIAELAARGDLFCRPPRRFFGFGGRPGAMPPFLAPGSRPIPVPVPAAPPPPAAAQ
ncbi:MAG TPA: peptidoglycan-binding domain-containing protein [Xanthobacteraceae bacterium]|nr:peptidoglycan-binding domain-containing protein [Xanthobacteraceae bacterium]